MAETVTAPNPTDANTNDASATLLATAGKGTDSTQQTTPAETPAATTTETPAKEVPVTEIAKTGGAPETYVFKAPEGMEYAPEIVTAFSGAAKKANLTQEAASALLGEMAPAVAAQQAEQVKAVQRGWSEASTADKEFGGEKLQENLGIARRAMDALDPLPVPAKIVDGKPVDAEGKPLTTPLRTLLEASGLGSHPEVLRLLYRAGKAISEDSIVMGRGSSVPKDLASVLYDNTPSKG